ncbi:MAG: M23 family metallopeptidase [Bacteroidales bacterium]|nr:M23 family metallopeptidase [Bacteroidales bacterium]
MSREQYIIDRNLRFRRSTRTVWNVLKSILKYAVATVSLAVFYYIVFALVVNTDSERRLIRENRLYERTYQDMLAREQLLSDVIDGLEVKDDQIYEEIFHARAPHLDALISDDYLAAADTVPDSEMVEYVYGKVQGAEKTAARIEDNFLKALSLIASEDRALPPMSLPLDSISFAQVGASVGQKVNPFYKVETSHNGVDLIAPQGDPVLAVADGTVTDIIHERKGLGNVVEITHPGGYVTRYAHLADIKVSRGQRVQRGRRIASVGISGNSFAPHLHFELIKDGEYLNPVDCFFAGVTPEEYAAMELMASRTGQSLD